MRAILTLLAGLPVSVAATPTMAAQITPSAELQTIANFFVHPAFVVALMRGSCGTGYRTKLSSNLDDQALENEIPGIHARMVEAASDFCEVNMPEAIAHWHKRIMADWSTLNGVDRARVDKLLTPMVERIGTLNPQFREGDMAMSALTNAVKANPSADAAFTASLHAFSKTPGGTALLNRIFDYKATVDASLKNGDNEVIQVFKDALRAARRAANAYAREKGFHNVYSE